MLHIGYICWSWFCNISDEIINSGEEGKEPMSSQQITLWLQGLFLFALVWTIGGTINADSRKKFDCFYRNLLMGMNDQHPRPKSVKLTKNNLFPEKGKLESTKMCFFFTYKSKFPKVLHVVSLYVLV